MNHSDAPKRPDRVPLSFAWLGIVIAALAGCTPKPTTIPVDQSATESVRAEPTITLRDAVVELAPSSATDAEHDLQPAAVDPIAQPTRQQQLQRAVELQQVAAKSLAANQIDDAYRSIRQARALDDQNLNGIFLYARILGARKRFPEAIRMLDRLAKSDPTVRLPALGQTAQWMVNAGDWQHAEQRYRSLLEVAPNAAIVHNELAALLMRQGRRFEAQPHLNALCRQGDIDERWLRSLLCIATAFPADARAPQLEPIGRLGQARFYLSQDQPHQATEVLNGPTLDRIDFPRQEQALLARIAAVTDQDDTNRDGSADSANPDAWLARGIFLAAHQHHESAVRCFCEAVLQDSTDATAYQRLADSLSALGQTENAARAIRRSEQIRRTQSIGSQLADSPAPDEKLVDELAVLLDQLNRPVEAIAWRAVNLAYNHASRPDVDLRQKMSQLNQQRLNLLNTASPASDHSFVVCGVDLDTLRDKLDSQ
ncbi:tetratricopeptide repeat protein [Stieleria sp. TO1_6]|uniref:tetratricopeptide repeat protein n=1 Tax=Stieleria tagensis TaxID=2956795 RepID=UPI00209B6EA9|nr:tetratricopeptide repeat protein [Stieleria tagensis]MCO8122946.1 tetratricopeptide repeat protein [Stieleria tagensis]